LAQWNGLDLEVLRLYGVAPVPPGIRELVVEQRHWEGLPGLVVGSDPAGFLYLEGSDGKVFVYDTDGGDVKLLCAGLDELFTVHVFGREAEAFGGTEWASEVRRVGIRP
jgi:hypothetical protein